MLHGDKGYDSNAIRRQVEGKGVMPNIPPKANRRWKNCFSPVLYRNRNAIERMFGRLKDFRRIATRYDRLADNFLAAVCLAATAGNAPAATEAHGQFLFNTTSNELFWDSNGTAAGGTTLIATLNTALQATDFELR